MIDEQKGMSRRRLAGRLAAGAALTVLAHFSPPAAHASDGAPKTRQRLLVLGDSLSAEYGLARGSGWVALLEQRLAQQAPGWQAINASISGETTSGGRTRLPGLLAQHQPQLVIIELGGNDALRGLPLASTRENLLAMIGAARQRGAQVLLLGMQVPPNYGTRYAQEFSQLFADAARSERTALVPFFLKGVADAADPLALFQPDRIHPNAQAQPMMLGNVWPTLRPLLRAGKG